jgi:uncharacterized Zn ribbon protein
LKIGKILDIKGGDGNLLSEGDFVQIIKDPKVKGLRLKQCFVKKV